MLPVNVFGAQYVFESPMGSCNLYDPTTNYTVQMMTSRSSTTERQNAYTIYLQNNGGDADYRIAYLRFTFPFDIVDLVPDNINAVLDSAKIYIGFTGCTGITYSGGDRTIEMGRIDIDWDFATTHTAIRAGTSWPWSSELVDGPDPAGADFQFVEFDATTIVQAWIDGTAEYGVAFRKLGSGSSSLMTIIGPSTTASTQFHEGRPRIKLWVSADERPFWQSDFNSSLVKNSMREDTPTATNANNWVRGWSNTQENVWLISWALPDSFDAYSTVPASTDSAQISQAYLVLPQETETVNPATFTEQGRNLALYAMTYPWDPGDATWNESDNSANINWGSGDFDAVYPHEGTPLDTTRTWAGYGATAGPDIIFDVRENIPEMLAGSSQGFVMRRTTAAQATESTTSYWDGGASFNPNADVAYNEYPRMLFLFTYPAAAAEEDGGSSMSGPMSPRNIGGKKNGIKVGG